MLQVRQGVFETNSSSTHSITIVPLSEFHKWTNDEVYLNEGWWWYHTTNPAKDKTFITKDEAISLVMTSKYHPDGDPYEMPKEEFDKLFANEYGIYSYVEFLDRGNLETYEEHYTSEHGDDIVAFGEYGYDG